jgi:uncharacterized damage-inducible protein DinB
MKKLFSTVLILFTAGLMISVLPINAQERSSSDQFKIDFFKVYDSSSGKIMELTDAISADDYDWRPTESVRSIKESLIHLARAHYYLASKLGSPIPEKIESGENEQSINSKEEVEGFLLASIEHVKSAVQNVKHDQLYEEIDFFGGKETRQRVVLQVSEHMAEHLGQLIVYARMRDVTPPWSDK